MCGEFPLNTRPMNDNDNHPETHMADLRRKMDAVMESSRSLDGIWLSDIGAIMNLIAGNLAEGSKHIAHQAAQNLNSRMGRIVDGFHCRFIIRAGSKGSNRAGRRRGISKYTDAIADMSFSDFHLITLAAEMRASDHAWEELENRIKRIGPPEEFEADLLAVDVDRCILVRGHGGFRCNWSELDWKTQKVNLINGEPAPVHPKSERGAMITGTEFSVNVPEWDKIRIGAQKEFRTAIYEFSGRIEGRIKRMLDSQ